jgi:DNA repair protein RecO (recombination protein O)
MLKRTRGIVLGHIKYKESSIIVKVFTEEFGSSSFIVNGVRSSKSKGKAALYQPLTLLDLVIYYKESKELMRISEAKMASSFSEIPFDPVKRTIGMFLTEFLSKTLREEQANRSLFEFLFHSIELLDHLQENVQNFHLQLLLKSANYLGYGPQGDLDFMQQLIEAGVHFNQWENEQNIINRLINEKYGASIEINNANRRELLHQIIKFYTIHLHQQLEIKSLEVLKTVMSAR